MPKRESFQGNSYYHVYNRGLEKSIIFPQEKDYERFLYYLSTHQEKMSNVKISAYALLPNHFHFLLYNQQDGLDISKLLSKVTASYAKYFCAKYNQKPGFSLFEGRFKSKLIDSEEYLQQCKMYIELNPLKHQLVDRIEDRIWTSYDEKESGSMNHSVLDFEWEF